MFMLLVMKMLSTFSINFVIEKSPFVPTVVQFPGKAQAFAVTYLPHKAVAEVSNHNAPLGRGCESQRIRDSSVLRVNCFETKAI